jgi:hypothetical protein
MVVGFTTIKEVWFGFMVFSATFNNISVISWRSVLLGEKSGIPGENDQPVASHRQTLTNNVAHLVPCNVLQIIICPFSFVLSVH